MFQDTPQTTSSSTWARRSLPDDRTSTSIRFPPKGLRELGVVSEVIRCAEAAWPCGRTGSIPSSKGITDGPHSRRLGPPVNGLRGPRRTASPVRLTLNSPLGGDIDGAWWPHTSSIASELPELIDVLHTPLGEVVDININWSATSGAPLMITQSSAALMKMRWNDSRQRIMVVVGRLASARLLVIPNMTTPQLGMMVMRRAAGMTISDAEQESLEYQAADRLVLAAAAQSAADNARTS